MHMPTYNLDQIDKQLLTVIQNDARYTALDLAEQIGVSDNTIHHHLDNLEDAGVINGYQTKLGFDQTGLTLYYIFICTAAVSERDEIAQQALEIPEVVEVTELMTGQRNLHIKAVGSDDEDFTRVTTKVDDLSLTINDENFISAEYCQPLDFSEVEIEQMLEN